MFFLCYLFFFMIYEKVFMFNKKRVFIFKILSIIKEYVWILMMKYLNIIKKKILYNSKILKWFNKNVFIVFDCFFFIFF